MRRHVPRDSPNCTREFGPIDAMSRDALLGPARTTTQSLETELTQRDGTTVFDDLVATALLGGLSTVDGDIAAMGAGGIAIGPSESFEVALGVSVDGDCTRSTLTVPASCTRDPMVSEGAAATTGGTALTDAGEGAGLATVESDFRAAVDRTSGACFRSVSRRNQTTPNNATSAPTPTRFQTTGLIGGGSGFVPHQRHDPTLSG